MYPYNAFLTPRDILTAFHGTASRRPLLIPNLLPAGLDPQAVIDERNRFIDARILQRRRELEELPANLSQTDLSSLAFAGSEASSSSSSSSLASQKVRALVELKSLRLLERQRALREQVVHGLKPACSLALPLDRTLFRRVRKPSLADARQIEQLERKQKLERERRAKQKHLDHLSDITEHGRHLVEAHRAHETKFHKLGKALLKFHVDAEKEEQKRVERVSKERLKALRADDEEGYLKLIDTAKDTRITHLLRQTDSFLESLAAAVSAQQSEARAEQDQDVLDEQTAGADGAVDESRFGAQPVFADEAKDKVDYYNVAHRVKETITKQPSILVGGELKGYQLKGLEWMVSLYNNHVNGILADEMGLGKTIQTLSLITYLIETKRQPGPYLVIVPLSTMPNWISEFDRWAPSVKVVSYKGTPAQRKGAQAEIRHGNFQVLLTTFEYIIKDRPLLAKVKWLHMIIDEGHRMKNTQSKLSVTLTQYYSSRYRLILTGTPLQVRLLSPLSLYARSTEAERADVEPARLPAEQPPRAVGAPQLCPAQDLRLGQVVRRVVQRALCQHGRPGQDRAQRGGVAPRHPAPAQGSAPVPPAPPQEGRRAGPARQGRARHQVQDVGPPARAHQADQGARHDLYRGGDERQEERDGHPRSAEPDHAAAQGAFLSFSLSLAPLSHSLSSSSSRSSRPDPLLPLLSRSRTLPTPPRRLARPTCRSATTRSASRPSSARSTRRA